MILIPKFSKSFRQPYRRQTETDITYRGKQTERDRQREDRQTENRQTQTDRDMGTEDRQRQTCRKTDRQTS